MSPCLASSLAADWELVDTGSLPRHAFERMIAFAETNADPFAELVALRNALTPTGSLLLVLRGRSAPDVLELVERAGFTRVRELARGAQAFATLELKR